MSRRSATVVALALLWAPALAMKNVTGCTFKQEQLYSCTQISADERMCKGQDITKESAWNQKALKGCSACAEYSEFAQKRCDQGREEGRKEGRKEDNTYCFTGCEEESDENGGPGTQQNGDPGSFMTNYGFIIGIVLTVGGCFISNLGTNLQKVSMNENSQRPVEQQRTVFKQPMWVTGCVCMIAGSIADFVALGFAPQSMLAPLATFTLVFNVFMAQYLNKETPTATNILATMIIVGGTVLVVMFGDQTTKCYKLDELVCRFADVWTITYLGIVFAFMALAAFKSVQNDRAAEERGTPMHERKDVAIWMAPFGGVCGGNTFLCAKAISELIKAQVRGETALFTFPGLALLVGLVAFLLMQVRFLNEALRRYDILVIVPIYQTFWILSGTMAGLIYFKEYVVIRESPLRTAMFFLGVSAALCGVAVLARGTREAENKRATLLLDQEDDESKGLMGRHSYAGRANQRDSVVDAFTKYMARSSHHYGQKPGFPGGGDGNVWSEWGGSGLAQNAGDNGGLMSNPQPVYSGHSVQGAGRNAMQGRSLSPAGSLSDAGGVAAVSPGR